MTNSLSGEDFKKVDKSVEILCLIARVPWLTASHLQPGVGADFPGSGGKTLIIYSGELMSPGQQHFLGDSIKPSQH